MFLIFKLSLRKYNNLIGESKEKYNARVATRQLRGLLDLQELYYEVTSV